MGVLFGVGLALAHSACGAELPEASWSKLPRWHGFNLLEKFMVHSNQPFKEDDFRMISELGFNFVRLPMDYRCWILDGDWEKFNEQTLTEIDQAVEYGRKYGVHVMINFHRAPGYTVAQPPEAKSLWTDADAQRVCKLHWQTFARRYRGIPSSQLSFNLFNEPAGPTEDEYVAVVRPIVEAIRAEDPDRLIVSDGLGWGRLTTLGLLDLKVAQATRGYSPMGISHYQASWIDGSDTWPLPTWPQLITNGILTNPTKADMSAEAGEPMRVSGNLASARKLAFTVGVVSSRATLVVATPAGELFRRELVSGPGEGEWKESRPRPEWNTYQNLWDKTFEVDLPAGTQEITLRAEDGDWLEISKLAITDEAGTTRTIELLHDWNRQPAQLTYQPGAPDGDFSAAERTDREYLWRTDIEPWLAWQKAGGGVMVGEFGAFNRTPHDVVMRWLNDLLDNWQRAGWGWAMWNFRGSFGILDSDREDVAYEDYQGHKLDREMLTLLQRYLAD